MSNSKLLGGVLGDSSAVISLDEQFMYSNILISIPHIVNTITCT